MKNKRIKTDLRILLAVFALVLLLMGIFAWAFRKIHVGYVEEDGHVVTSSKVYDRLSRGSEDEASVLLSTVRSNDEVFLRGGKYYVGPEMMEYESVYPLYANNGLSLYFMNDSAQLVTEEFELLSTYQGMFVADGTSFNADRTQADVEIIYLVKLKNGLYENSLPITLTRDGMEEKMPVNSIVNFGDNYIRFYDEKGGTLEYHALEDVSGITVHILDKSWSYVDFLEALKGAGQSASAGAGEKDANPEKEPEDTELEEEIQETLTGDQVPSVNVDHTERPEDTAEDAAEQDKEQGTKGAQSSNGNGNDSKAEKAGSSGSNGSSSDSGSSDESSTEVSSGSQQGSSRPRPGSNTSAEPPYQKPKVVVKSVTAGTYKLDFDVDIQDDGGYLKKLTARVRWNGGKNEQRKSVKESGEYTINNLESDQDMVFVIEMKYKNTAGEYVTEEVYSAPIKTLSIQEGTNTLYLDYVPDTWTEAEQGGYERIYPKQIEIRNLTVREGDDSILEDDTSTMDYVRYFRIKVFEVGGSSTEPVSTFTLGNSDKKKMLIQTPAGTEGDAGEDSGTGEGTGTGGDDGTGDAGTPAEPVSQGLNWKSDQTMNPLPSDKNYYYEFELVDRYGESLKVQYENGAGGASRYDDAGNLITGTASDRKAYTCKEHPTGKLSLGAASYDSQTVTTSMENPDLCAVSDLYLTVKDSYGRYIEHNLTDGNTRGILGTGILTDDARFMFMEGVSTSTSQGVLPLYEGITGANTAYDATAKKQSWEKVQVPSFANSTYTISMNIRYNIGDRYGDVDENGNHTGVYTAVLASRSNCKTTTLNTLGNVSFSRGAGEVSSDSVNYNYASVEISDKLLPLIYRYDYTLQNVADETDVPLKLRISKEYEEVKKESQGILLTVPGYGEQEAKDWSFNYSYSYRLKNDSSRTVHTVSGRIYLDGDKVKRTILLDGEPDNTSEVSVDVTDGDFYSAFQNILDLDTCAKVRADDSIKESDIIVESTAAVTLDFAPIMKNDSEIELDINKNYSIGMSYLKLRSAFDYVKNNETDKDFSDVILCALSRYAAPLTMNVSGLTSAQIYEATAAAYAYQSGNLEAVTDEDGNVANGEPVITLVTTTDTSLRLNTLKGEPKVNMELFSTSSELTLFDFYVLDKDGAILPRKAGDSPSVTVSIYRYDVDPDTGEAKETLVARETGLPVAGSEAEAEEQARNLTFSGLTNGQTYRIKVTAGAYDITPDGSDTKYDYLIGTDEASTFWKENGVWENVVGTAVTTDLTLEEVLSEDPFTLENQLIDFTSSETEGSGWEVGYLNGDGSIYVNTSYRTTPYMDLRSRDENGALVPLGADDTFLLKGVWDQRIFYYDADKNYLGYVKYYGNNAGAQRTSIVKLPARTLNGTSKGDYVTSDIAYARVCIPWNYANEAFLGRLADGYLTLKDGDSAYTDIWGSIRRESNNHWNELGANHAATRTYTTTAGKNIGLPNYYENAVSVGGGQVFMLTGNIASAQIERYVVFLDSNDKIILNESQDGTPQYLRRTQSGMLLTVPKVAVKMLVGYSSSDENASGLGLYVLTDTKIAESYNEWRQGISEVQDPSKAQSLAVGRKRGLNGSTGAYTVSGENSEATSKIAVNPGELYLVNTMGNTIALFDENDRFVALDSGSSGQYQYLVIPEGVHYVRLANSRWSASSVYDNSLMNGAAYNQDGCYPIIFLKCGSLNSVYGEKLVQGGSSGQMYANLRIQLKDGVNNYFTDGLTSAGSYWLEVHEADYQGVELSDAELMAAPAVKRAEGTIRILSQDGGSVAEEINRCRTIPVEKGKTYKVILFAKVGSRSQVELGDVYFTVREDGSPIYGISAAFQIPAIRSNNTGDYVLNKDITMDDTLPANGGPLYGVLDLQGHTLTNARYGTIFDNIGSAAKKQGTIRNGTIVFQSTRNASGSMSRLAGSNYGTLENLNFKVDNENPSSISGGEKVYDNSNWTNENWVNILSYQYGTLRNFTIEYMSDLVSCSWVGFMEQNYGLIENGYIYGDGCVRGGTRVGGLVSRNNTNGTVRNIYSTIDSKSNSTAFGGNITTTYGNGTIVGENSGKVEGVLATGNVYQYSTIKNGSNYQFTTESYYADRGCAVGITTTRMDTTKCYYATVGSNRRVNYSTSSRNERVESGVLIDPSWFRTLFGGSGLDEEHLETLLSGGYYPWVDMGAATEKYSILQPYLSMDIGSSSNFDLMKSEVLEYIYDDDGYASARVKFTFMNASAYNVTDIMIDGLDCTLSGQKMNEDTGFYEVEGLVKVPDGGNYVSGYNVKAVYYRRSENASKSSVRYSYGTYVSTNGERIVDAAFYYPLKDTKEWTNLFTKEHKDWNFRIWGEEEWDFSKQYVDTVGGKEVLRFPNSVKDFDYTGHLDGTLYEKNAEGQWIPAMDGGQVKCHVLKNLCDYNAKYSGSTVSGWNIYGYVFQKVKGGISNLVFDGMSVGIERPEHFKEKPMTSGLADAVKTLATPFGPARQTSSGSSNKGLIGTLDTYSSMENVHLTNLYMAPHCTAEERLGGLAAYSSGYSTFNQCSVTGAQMTTSTQAANLYVGGLVAYSANYDSFNSCYVTDVRITAVSSSNASFNALGVGGLVGYGANSLSIANSYTAGTMNSEVMNTGGMVGRTAGTSSLDASYSAMNISVSGANSAGLVAKNEGTMNLNGCLYTGGLSAASKSGTIHLMVGYNSSALSLDNCYVYQPHMEQEDSMLDAGVELVNYGTLTGDTSFYEGIFSDAFLYRWDGYGTTPEGGAYLPAVAVSGAAISTDEEGNPVEGMVTSPAYGQVIDGTCYVPAIAEESLQITDVWAFASEDRTVEMEAASGGLVSSSTGKWYNNLDDFYQILGDIGIARYEPNDIEFTLVLGSSDGKDAPANSVKSVTIEGLADGGLLSQNFINTGGPAFSKEMLGVNTYRCDIAPDNRDGYAGKFAYRIRILGAEVTAYRDIYNIIVTLDNGVVLKQTFQFRDAKGNEEAKFLSIHNAYEWNLYMGESGRIPEMAAKDTAPEELKKYAGYSYKGYQTASMNVEIAGEVDFSVLENLGDNITETPVMNVLANNVRGTVGTVDGDAQGLIRNLNMPNTERKYYGLFKSISGDLATLEFENNTIQWKKDNSALANSGLIGNVSGDVTGCKFTNTVLSGGNGEGFGIIGSGDGTIKDVTVVNSFVESDGNAVGGLVGILRGDLIDVEAYGTDDTEYGYGVTGHSYIGGLVGRLYATEHEVNGHEVIGGRDYTSELGEGQTEREDLNPDGWYSRFMSTDTDYYRTDDERYTYDSLSCNYALVRNVSIKSAGITAMYEQVGGIAGRSDYMKKGMGYGYIIIENVTVGDGTAGDVHVNAKGINGTTTAYAGGLFGYMRVCALHQVVVNGVHVDGDDGSHTGGLFGYANDVSDYDYSGYGSGDSRVSCFLMTLDDVTLQNSTVSGGSYTGGLIGRVPYFLNAHNITGKDNVVLAVGNYEGGLYGLGSNTYMTDTKVTGQQVYNGGAAGKYIGGVAGYNYGGSRRLDVSDVQVTAAGESSYVGGISGEGLNLRDTTAGANTIANLFVYGHDYVGGVAGNGNTFQYADVNPNEGDSVKVVGTGDFVGGLFGTTGSNVKYVKVQNLTAVGSGVGTGGIAGKRTSGTISNSEFAHISVTGSRNGGGTSDALVWIENEETDGISNGSAVGGITGASRNANLYFNSIEDVTVYGGDNYTGGLYGIQSGGYTQETSIENVTVHSEGDRYVGGVAGHCYSGNGQSKIAMNHVTVRAPKASYVGGFAGYMGMSVTSTANIYRNVLKVTLDVGDSAGSYVGGLTGYARELYAMDNNTVEATIQAPNASYVGGFIGCLERTAGKQFWFRWNESVAEVTGADCVSGMIGSSQDYPITGYDGTYNGSYANLTAAHVTATKENATASYFYSYEAGSDTIKDWNTTAVNKDTGRYPYRLRLWDESWIQIGSQKVLATDQTFRSQIDEWNNMSAGYWRGSEKALAAKKAKDTNMLALVTTEDLKTTELYVAGTDNLGYGIYTANVEGNKVTFEDLDNMLPTEDRWNLYGLNTDMTGGSAVYMPIPITPLLLSGELAENVNGTDRYTKYFFGSAERSGNTLTFSISDGIPVPGTDGSILKDGGGTAGSLADIDLKTAPRIYASNAFTLNVDFSQDDIYAGAWIEVYTVEGDTRTLAYSVQTSEDNRTYDMYYDFRTPLVIEVANTNLKTDPGVDNSARYVAYSAEIEPESLCSRVSMGSTVMYAIGNNGKVFQYQDKWSTGSELTNLGLEQGEKCINIAAEGANVISVLTDKGRILSVSGSSAAAGRTLNAPVGPANDSSLTGSSTTTGQRTGIPGLQSSAIGQRTGIPGLQSSAIGQRTGITGPQGQRLIASASGIPSGVFAAADTALPEDIPESVEDVSESEENVPESGSEVEFDDRLLSAEPLYEFDYKGYHICTYLTYSLIYDQDQVTVRNMQLFVKNDKLFALNAPDEIVPGSVLIDTYQGHTYMSVLRKDGRMVDLMDAINYPEDFVNRNIKNISSNLYSDLAYVQVEYEDGGIVTFNYLTGSVVYAEEGDGEGGAGEEDFLSFIMGFFRDRLDTAYAEVSSAYQNALTMQDYLSTQPWKDWFAKEGVSSVNGTADNSDSEQESLDTPESGAGENAVQGEGDILVSGSETPLEQETDGTVEAAEGGRPSQTIGGGVDMAIEGTMPESAEEGDAPDKSGGGMAGAYADNEDAGEDQPEETASTDQPEGEQPAKDPAQPSASGEPAQSGSGEAEPAKAEAVHQGPAEQEALADELIIAYDADAKGYAVYAAGDLLTEEEEQLVSVDKQMEAYLDKGGELTGAEPKLQSLEVDRTQRKGLVILFVIGGAIGCMLIILGIQRYSRKDARRRR